MGAAPRAPPNPLRGVGGGRGAEGAHPSLSPPCQGTFVFCVPGMAGGGFGGCWGGGGCQEQGGDPGADRAKMGVVDPAAPPGTGSSAGGVNSQKRSDFTPKFSDFTPKCFDPPPKITTGEQPRL